MIDYEQFENDIVSLLCPPDNSNTVYKADPLPDSEGEFTRSFDKPRVFISSGQSDYAESESTDMVIQTETITFEAIIKSNTRRGPSGTLAILANIREKLIGYRFKGCTRIQILRHGWTEGTQNNWNYSAIFTLTTKVVEKQPEETGPLSKKIDFA